MGLPRKNSESTKNVIIRTFWSHSDQPDLIQWAKTYPLLIGYVMFALWNGKCLIFPIGGKYEKEH
jgi:hypothetical protein